MSENSNKYPYHFGKRNYLFEKAHFLPFGENGLHQLIINKLNY